MSGTRMNTSLKADPKAKSSKSSLTSGTAVKKAADPMTITPELVWQNREKAIASPLQHQQQQQQQPSRTTPDRRSATPPNNERFTAAKTTKHSSSKINNKAADGSPTTDNAPSSPQEQAATKSAAHEKHAAQQAAALKTTSTVLAEELQALKVENEQLHDIEKQFWVLLDEREQLQAELRSLTHGNSPSPSTSASSFHRGGAGALQQFRAPHCASEMERNYQQMGHALDEALGMLITLDKTAASRLSGASSASSPVVPGTLIHRFLEFCSMERGSGGGGGARVMESAFAKREASPSQRSASRGGEDRNGSSDFANRTAALLNSTQSHITSAIQDARSRGGGGDAQSPHNITDSITSQYQRHTEGGGGGDHSASSTAHQSSLSQALRVAKDEVQFLKMELDRSDLSRLQALDDVDRMQSQVTLLSKSVVELRSAYASARAQADANAKSAETVHEVTVALAERDAEIAHLKARIAEMQRLAASGGSALAGDTQRIRAELAARVSK